jgi:hypothetical protein
VLGHQPIQKRGLARDTCFHSEQTSVRSTPALDLFLIPVMQERLIINCLILDGVKYETIETELASVYHYEATRLSIVQERKLRQYLLFHAKSSKELTIGSPGYFHLLKEDQFLKCPFQGRTAELDPLNFT